MKANLLYQKETKLLLGPYLWVPVDYLSGLHFLKKCSKIWEENKPEGEKNYISTKKKQKPLKNVGNGLGH